MATTTSIPSRLSKYSVPKNEMALVHITEVEPDKKRLTIADVWRVPKGQSTTPFLQETERVSELLKKPPHAVKRKADQMDSTLEGLLTPENKRMHSAFGSSLE